MGNLQIPFSLRLGIHTAAHAAVDCCCFYVLFSAVAPAFPDAGMRALLFLSYNAAAFGLQPLIGLWNDRRPNVRFGMIGCALLLCGLLLARFPVAAMLLCALGNAAFHAGAGRDVLLSSVGRMWPNGVFVASGALGVAFGTLLGNADGPAILPLLLAVLCLAGEGVLFPVQTPLQRFCAAETSRPFPLLLALLLVSIAIRSFGGMLLPLPWKTTALSAVFAAFAVCAGKATGGFLAERFGARRMTVIALLLSAPLLFFGSANPWLSAAGLLLFNIPMAVTLCAAADLFPGYPGFAFGLTTLSLLLGTLPTAFAAFGASAPLLFALLTVFAAGCMLLLCKQERRTPHAHL